MDKVVSIIGIDISKRYFQLHGATAGGEPVLRKKLTRSKLLGFLAKAAPPVGSCWRCAVAPTIGGGQIQELGHVVRLIPPVYVKAVRQEAEERRERRGGDRRGGPAADDAVRGREDRGSAGVLGGVPEPGAPRAPADPDDQRAAGSPRGVRPRRSAWDPQHRETGGGVRQV